MIREKLVQKEIGARADFRWRSHEMADDIPACPGRPTC